SPAAHSIVTVTSGCSSSKRLTSISVTGTVEGAQTSIKVNSIASPADAASPPPVGAAAGVVQADNTSTRIPKPNILKRTRRNCLRKPLIVLPPQFLSFLVDQR